jgi:hypothetical protein
MDVASSQMTAYLHWLVVQLMTDGAGHLHLQRSLSVGSSMRMA